MVNQVRLKRLRPQFKRKTFFKLLAASLLFSFIILAVGTLTFGKSQNDVQSFSLNTGRLVFRADEQPSFKVDVKLVKQKDFWDKLRSKVSAASLPRGELLYNDGRADNMPVSIESNGKDYRAVVKPQSDVKPGKYTLKITVDTTSGPKTQEQKFAWGVLALNSDKATYLPGETVYLQMAVLSSNGTTICDAPLKVSITNPQGNKTDVSVERSNSCKGDTYSSEPDYSSRYKVGASGRYNVRLQLAESDYTLDDQFEVASSLPFDIQRSGPTRIFPPADYQMELKIHANQNFNGTVNDNLPQSFTITPEGNGKIAKNDSDQQISWQVDWQAGRDYVLSYSFKTPSKSPDFYFIGPLTLTDSNNNQAFKEARRWQLAIDASTFGDTSIGASHTNAPSGYVSLAKATLSEAGTAYSMTGYQNNPSGGAGGAQVFRYVIYNDNGSNYPGTFVAVTSEISVADGAPLAWRSATFSSPVSLSAATYWIGYWTGAANSGDEFYYTSGAANSGYYSNTGLTYSSTGNPADFPAGGTGSTIQSWSLYAIYAPSPSKIFGMTTIGASVHGAGGGFKEVNKYTTPSDISTVSKISIYGYASTTNGAGKAIIYADSSGSPGALVAVSDATTVTTNGGVPKWWDFNFASPVSLSPSTAYWFGFWHEQTYSLYNDTDASGTNKYRAEAYPGSGSPSDPFGTASNSTELYSLYMTYTTWSGPIHDTSNAWTTFATSSSQTITVGSNSNRVLFVFWTREWRSGCQNLSSVTWNGVSLTNLMAAGTTSTAREEIWYIINPDTGAHSLAWSYTGSTSCNIRWGFSSYYNANQSAPTNTYNSTQQSTTVTSASNTLTGTTSGNLVVDFMGGIGGSLTTINSGSGQTQTLSVVDRPGAGQGYGSTTSSYYRSSGGSVSTSETAAAGSWNGWAYMQFELAAVAVGCTPTTADLMRHGNYFCNGSESGFFWTT